MQYFVFQVPLFKPLYINLTSGKYKIHQSTFWFPLVPNGIFSREGNFCLNDKCLNCNLKKYISVQPKSLLKYLKESHWEWLHCRDGAEVWPRSVGLTYIYYSMCVLGGFLTDNLMNTFRSEAEATIVMLLCRHALVMDLLNA